MLPCQGQLSTGVLCLNDTLYYQLDYIYNDPCRVSEYLFKNEQTSQRHIVDLILNIHEFCGKLARHLLAREIKNRLIYH